MRAGPTHVRSGRRGGRRGRGRRYCSTLSTTACTAAVTRSAVVTRGSKRSVRRRSIASMLTPTTPSIFLAPVTTCDAQELHISAEISSEISSVSATAVAAGACDALPGVRAGEPQAMTAANKRKGANRTFALCAWRPSSRWIRKYYLSLSSSSTSSFALPLVSSHLPSALSFMKCFLLCGPHGPPQKVASPVPRRVGSLEREKYQRGVVR